MIILASQSPRRQKLMSEDITNNFVVKTYDINESSFYNLPPIEAVKNIAKAKCEVAVSFNPHDTIITADTVVVINDQIIGKPKNEKDAFNILKLLSGKTHEVITGFCIFNNNQYVIDYALTKVVFNDLTDELINSYIASGSPMDKAGAYGYQDNKDYPLVKSIVGSKKNVIGFPSDEIKNILKNMGVL